MLLVIGDLNAKVGDDNTNYERAMGKHGCGTMNNNGERLADFCLNNDLVIGGTIFPHKNIHKLTWQSPNGRTLNQIDHIIINGKWRRSLENVRAFRGADAGSDHNLVAATVKLKLRKAMRQEGQRRLFDIAKLRCPKIQKQFAVEVKNRFQALTDIDGDDTSVESKWDKIKKSYNEAAASTIGYRKKKNKEWLTSGSWEKIEERKQLKMKMLNARSQRLQDQLKHSYASKDREVKKSARKDKRQFIDDLAEKAELAATRGEMSTVYKITKQLCGNYPCNPPPVRAKDGSPLTSEKEQTDRWVQHFQEVLNQPEPHEPAILAPPQDSLDIDVGQPSASEVRESILATKNCKAPGNDSIHAEMLKADLDIATTVLVDLFDYIWDTNTIPCDWTTGLIVKLPKKGNLQNCDNWRGITLLSIPSKIFCRILLRRIDSAIDSRLRQEQAGFRKGRGCIDQIFALRNIIEQCLEWNAPLHINFIDFRKAFDSVHRDTLWKILESYGIPEKIITLINLFYKNFECSVITGNKTSEPFPVNTGVRQGCILSPMLFLITIDWVMRQTTSDKARGIQWTLLSHLEDLDFADDLALLSSRKDHLQAKTERLNKFSTQTGLHISTVKTKVMSINSTNPAPITVNNKDLDFVEDFTYLGSLISKDNGAKKDIQSRLGKARGAFARLRPIWKSKQYSLKTKLKLYNSNVKSVLLYGSECWRVVKSDMDKISAFHNGCLRKICRIFWPQKVSNQDLYSKTNSKNIIHEIKHRRLKWLGHVLRMEQGRIPKTSLQWTPVGKRKPGRPKTTWRRTVEAELKEMGLTWGEASKLAKDRQEWRRRVAALFPTREEEVK
jgi:hypothetical protein